MIFSILLIFCSFCLAVRYLFLLADTGPKRSYRQQEYERYESIIARDPSQAGSIAELAQMYYDDGDTGKAVELWRQAVHTLPHGPFSETWKRKLKRARAEHEGELRGEKPRDYVNQRACNQCLAIIRREDKICPECGAANFLVPSDRLNNKVRERNWATETLIICVLFWVVGIIFSHLPLPVKIGIAISSTVAILIIMLYPNLRRASKS